MPKHRYAVQHDGLTFKRSTDRTYTHVVLTPDSLAERIRQAHDSAAYDWKRNQAYHAAYVDGTSEFIPVPDHKRGEWAEQHKVEVAQQIERSRAWLAGGLAGLIADFEARTLAWWRKDHGDRDETWLVRGWAGRLDLAQKQAKPGDVILEVAHA